MGHHINPQGQFQSDKDPKLPPDKITLSFHDPAARNALTVFACDTNDRELANDILYRLQSLEGKENDE